MGWFDGFPFKTKEQAVREQKEFEQRVFPLGLKQREKALEVLRQINDENLREDELLFAFISAKDQYTLHDDPEYAFVQAQKGIRKVYPRLDPLQVDLVIALVRLDLEIDCLEEYPTPEQVKKLAFSPD